MIQVGLIGYAGRMGQLIAQEIEKRDDCNLVGGVVENQQTNDKPKAGLLITPDADKVIALSDVVIDFTIASSTPEFARKAAAQGKPFMSGTTGLSAEGMETLYQASKKIPLLYARNTSLSLAMMKRMVAYAAQLMADYDYDVAIYDEHHRMKKDFPSGTAKVLGEAVLQGNGGKKEPQYASVHAGYFVGNHEVIFAGAGETIRLSHSVTDRSIFARGAVQAALWLAQGRKPGLYGIDDVLGLPKIT
ncbi:MAG: 4-hydroxy-tetrahydrodipicolinate reductase [Bdellovibrionales bacterium]